MKKIYKTIALLFTFNFCFYTISYTQEIKWQNTIGGNHHDELTFIQQTSDGGYILGGPSWSGISGDKTENTNGLYDYWIVKTDSSGNIQWQNTIGGNKNDYLQAFQQTKDGGYLLGGYSDSDSTGDKTENSNGGSDYWVVKTDSIGNIEWQKTIGGSGGDELYSLQQATDGGYILGGTSNSDISGDKTENSKGGDDYWIVKTDSIGNIQWQKTIGGSGEDGLNSLQQATDGGYILGGTSNSDISGDKTENNVGSLTYQDYWIVKTDSFGNIQWQNTIGGSKGDDLKSIRQTFDGGFIIGGTTWSGISGDKTEPSMSFDCWIVKVDATGNIQWQNNIGGDSEDYLSSIQPTSDGGYLLAAGSYSGMSGDKTENRITGGYDDFWILKTDSIGNIIWQNTIGGGDFDALTSFQQITDGGYILGGSSTSNISYDKTENALGYEDFWIVKLTDKYNSITGKLFVDFNTNNVQDTGEISLQNKTITESNTGRLGFSQPNGDYLVSVLDSGNFTVATNASINYYNMVPVKHSAYFSSINQTDSLNDFAFQLGGVFNDVCVTITPQTRFRAGFNASYEIHYENVGTTTISPTVIFFPDTSITYINSTPVANSVTTDSVVWNFGPLNPFQTGNILITVNVDSGIPIGILISSGVRIEPVAGDANPSCNTSSWEAYTTASLDPNDIIVDEDTLWTTQFPNPPYLEYIIRFQNTGNDTAFNVKVLNPIDTFMLQLNSLEFVASSHPVNMSWIPWERNMQFKFDHILLPDSNVNESASHGFVRYRIKPKSTLSAGNIIYNRAAIYFDFNAPALTNNAVTQIVQSASIFKIQYSLFRVYPNPATDKLIISNLPFTGKTTLKILDLYGREVIGESLQANTIDVSNLSSGIYIIEVASSSAVARARFVKQ